MAQYIKTFNLNLKEILIHDIALLTPQMTKLDFGALKNSIELNGQETPIVMYKGRCVDGRHRIKALIELGETSISARNEQSNLSEEDIKNKVLNVYERRRHQTPTQKAIIAMRYYDSSLLNGERIGKGKAAETMGTSRNSMNKAEQLQKLAGSEIIELLFNGNKINIGTDSKPSMTDSLTSLVNHFKSNVDSIIASSLGKQEMSNNMTDEELDTCRTAVETLEYEYGQRMLLTISKLLYSRVNELEK